MPAATQIPDMHLMTIFAAKKQIWLNSIFNHVRRAPFAANQRVKSQVPPKIVMQKLRPAVHFPLPENLERFAIEHENAAGAVAIGCSKRADVNAFRPAMNCVWTRIIGARKNFFWLDYLNDLRFSRIGLGIDNVNTRRTYSWHNQVTAFDVRMRCIWAQRRAARVPTEMVQLITKLWHSDLAGLSAIGARVGINVDYQKSVVEVASGRIKRRYERVFLWRPSHGQPR